MVLVGCAPEPIVLVLEDSRGSLSEIEKIEFSLENAEQELAIANSGIALESSYGRRTLSIDYFAWAEVVNSSDAVIYEFEFEFGARDADGGTWAVKDTNYNTYRILPGETVRVVGELRSSRRQGEPVEPVVGIRATDFLFADLATLATPEVTIRDWAYDAKLTSIAGSGSVTNVAQSGIDDMRAIVWCTDAEGVSHADEVRINQLPLGPGDSLEFLFSWRVHQSFEITDCAAEVVVFGDKFDDPK